MDRYRGGRDPHSSEIAKRGESSIASKGGLLLDKDFNFISQVSHHGRKSNACDVIPRPNESTMLESTFLAS